MESNSSKRFEAVDPKWKIVEELGSGSFGTVYKIERKDYPEMKSALKIISIPASQNEVRSYKEENYDLDDKSVTSYFYGFVEEFIKEFQLMSQLRGNSNIVSYEDHDVKEHEDGIGWDVFIRMELLTPMNKHFANNAPKQSDIIKLGIDICKALEVCQKYKIIHRDIKPSNIFVSDTGDYKLGDFGVARTLEKTSSGMSKKGTYTYMAPEIFKGEKYNSNVDVYSLGIVLYKLLNNNLEPFRNDRSYSDGERAMDARMRGDEIPKPVNADGRLAEIVLKACSYNPKDRYESPIQMREELESILYNQSEGKVIYPEGDTLGYEPTDAEDNNGGGTVSMLDKKKKITAEEKKVQEETYDNGMSENEIAKLAFTYPPTNLDSLEAKRIVEQALISILPIYDSSKAITSVLRMNEPDRIKDMINSASTENLLVSFKALAYFISKGESKETIGHVQKYILGTLRHRNLSQYKEVEQLIKADSDKSKKNDSKLNERLHGIKVFLSKYWKIGAVVAAVVLLVVLCVSLFGNNSSGTIAPNENSSTIELYPTSEVSEGDLKSMSKIISERIEFLDINYKVIASEDKITIQLDNNFGESDIIKKRIADIIRADGKLAMTSFGWPTIEDCTGHLEEITVESETKDKFKRYYGDSIPELTMKKILSETNDQVNYLRIRIDGTLAIDFKKEVEDLQKDYCVSGLFDTEKHLSVFGGSAQASYSDIGAIVNIDNSNYREFILVPYEAAASEKAVQMLKHVLSSKQLDCVLEPVMLDEPEWETDESVFGDKQVASLDGDYIEVEYKLSLSYYTDYDEALETLKNRLDVVGLPYSVGYKGFDKDSVVIKISPEKFNADMVRFISEYSHVQLYSQYYDVNVQIKDVEIGKTESGQLCINLPLGSSYRETSIEELTNDYLEHRNGYDAPAPDISEINPATESIYLVAGDVTIASTTLADLQDDGILTFSNLLCFGKDSISDDEYWLLEMVKGYKNYNSILSGETLPIEEIEIRYYENGEFVTDNTSDMPWKYDNSSVDSTIVKIADKYGATVEKSYQARNTLVIKLDVKEDGNFADNFMSTIEKIYTECNFDSCSYKDVRFTDSNAGETNPTDAAEITFGKTSGKMTASYAFFDGPTYNKYQEDIKAIADTSQFYQSKMYKQNQ